MKQPRKYFFQPRVGTHYCRKWQGFRTLVVGVHLMCEEECSFIPQCCTLGGVRLMDDRCPLYAPHRAGAMAPYYRLSNCNAIELETYIYKDGKSPAFSSFTKYLLGERGNVSQERRAALWEHLAFYNFMQCFRPDSDTPAFAEAPEIYEGSLPAFRQLLAELQPQILYVWGNELSAYLRQKRIKGLTYEGEADMQAMYIHKFAYNCLPYSEVSEEQVDACFKLLFVRSKEMDASTLQALLRVLKLAMKARFVTCNGEQFAVPRGKKMSVAYLCSMLRRAYDFRWQDFDALFGYGEASSLDHAHADCAPLDDKRLIDSWVDRL